MKKLAVVLIACTLFVACDKIEGPIKETLTDLGDVDTTVTLQRALLEEYTGHKCGNCPELGSEKIAELDALFGSKLVTVSVHAGSFATFSPTASKYNYDFTTPTSIALYNKYGVQANPEGCVSRTLSGGKLVLGSGAWATAISAVLTQEPAQRIDIKNTFNEANKQLTVDVTVKYLKAGAADDNLTVYLVEDSIINWQKDYRLTNEDIPNFVHRHVLRGAVTPTFGDPLSTTAPAVGAIIKKSYTYTLKDGYVPKHCSVVAFVNNSGTDNVLQVAEKHIQ